MNSIKKNQIIVGALAVMIALAAYLSFVQKSEVDKSQYVFNHETALMDPKIQEAVQEHEKDDNDKIKIEEKEAVSQETGNEQDQIKIKEATDQNVDETASNAIDGEEADKGSASDKDALTETASMNKDKEVGEAVFVSSGAIGDTYFLDSKIKREQKRASRLEILNEVINNDQLSEDSKLQAISKKIDIQDRIEKEGAAESLLKAKGYENVFILLDDNACDVIIKADTLSQSQLAQIIDVTSRKTGVEPENVLINPAK